MKQQILIDHFKIQSMVDLDFVIGQQVGLPVGMESASSPEFRRRVLAAAISYWSGLRSIDYALKRYVDPGTYDEKDNSLGKVTSDCLRHCVFSLEEELKELHTEEPTFGVFGAEVTLYRIPFTIDTARTLCNRGLLLEVIPILRLCLEMISFAYVAFHMQKEEDIIALKAQSCISKLKDIYPNGGKFYGYLSSFAHWRHEIHGHFLTSHEEHMAVLKASVRYRAISLALCFVVLDVLIEVIRDFYGERGRKLVVRVQETYNRDTTRKVYQCVANIAELTELSELRHIHSFLK